MRLAHHLYRSAAWGGCALIAIADLAMLAAGDMRAVVILTLFLGLSVYFTATHSQLPNLFDLLFVIASIVNAGGYVYGFFDTVRFYDDLAHLFTAFSGTMALGYLVFRSWAFEARRHVAVFIIATASFGLALGALWEIFEYVTGLIDGQGDTIGDLAVDAVGALAGGAVAAAAMLRRHGRQGGAAR